MSSLLAIGGCRGQMPIRLRLRFRSCRCDPDPGYHSLSVQCGEPGPADRLGAECHGTQVFVGVDQADHAGCHGAIALFFFDCKSPLQTAPMHLDAEVCSNRVDALWHGEAGVAPP